MNVYKGGFHSPIPRFHSPIPIFRMVFGYHRCHCNQMSQPLGNICKMLSSIHAVERINLLALFSNSALIYLLKNAAKSFKKFFSCIQFEIVQTFIFLTLKSFISNIVIEKIFMDPSSVQSHLESSPHKEQYPSIILTKNLKIVNKYQREKFFQKILSPESMRKYNLNDCYII